MFTNLTSYFWGGGSAATPTEAVGTPSTPLERAQGVPEKCVDGLVVVPRVKELEAEEDWLMVDSHLSAGE